MESNNEASGRSSIFGGAKPVDTASKEREIEEKLEKLKVEPETSKQNDFSGERGFRSPKERTYSGDGEFRNRRDSNRSSDGDSRGRRDSEKESSPKEVTTPKEAPQPTVNVWKQRMETQKNTSEDDKKSPEETKENIDRPFRNNTDTKTVTQSGVPSGRGTSSRPYSRGGERGASRGRGRGRGRGDHPGRVDSTSIAESKSKEERKERKERKPAEPKMVDEQPPVIVFKAF